MNPVVNNPDYLAYRFNFGTENVEFLPINRSEIRRVSALKHDYIAAGRQLVPVPLAELVDVANNSGQGLVENPPRFIFHTAFCASTFLSRCLDVDGISVSLREPQILLDAANAKRLQWRSTTTTLDYTAFPKLALSLLQKHALPTEKLIIKPINSVNNIIPELMQITGSSKSLMLYTDARNFILSTLKKGEGGKQTVRSMFDLLRCDFEHLANLRLTHTIHMTDLRIAMTLWRLQIEQANLALQQFALNQTLASLYGETLIQKPLESLLAANRFLALDIPAEKIETIVSSDERFNDAKNAGQRFSLQKRAESYRVLEEFYGGDLNDGLQWLVRNNPGTVLRPSLIGALET